VAADVPLLTILPEGSALHAELLVPTRAIGFVRPGQEVSLRYEAFPYERFGQYRGTVKSVGKNVWTQGEKLGPLVIREPSYRIAVTVEQQQVQAGEQSLPLRSGMLVSADLLLEKRSLLEWLFQPIFQLRERMR
jgi:membrane fusion protein